MTFDMININTIWQQRNEISERWKENLAFVNSCLVKVNYDKWSHVTFIPEREEDVERKLALPSKFLGDWEILFCVKKNVNKWENYIMWYYLHSNDLKLSHNYVLIIRHCTFLVLCFEGFIKQHFLAELKNYFKRVPP